jgi:hypothetical protein
MTDLPGWANAYAREVHGTQEMPYGNSEGIHGLDLVNCAVKGCNQAGNANSCLGFPPAICSAYILGQPTCVTLNEETT